MSRNPQSLLLVFVQALSITFIFITGPVFLENILLFLLSLVAVAFGVWAVLVMTHKSEIQATPEPAKGSKLLTSGPYKYVRHPMYTSLLFFTLILVVNHFTFERVVFWFILLVDLIVKLNYEENILKEHFSDYPKYQKSTKKLIPFIY